VNQASSMSRKKIHDSRIPTFSDQAGEAFSGTLPAFFHLVIPYYHREWLLVGNRLFHHQNQCLHPEKKPVPAFAP
jgi:hypothetical protein